MRRASVKARLAASARSAEAARRRREKVTPGQEWHMPSSPIGRTVRLTSVSDYWVDYELVSGTGPRERRITLASLLATYQPGPPESRDLSVDERMMARHLLQDLKEAIPSVRDAMEPATGVLRITDRAWYVQWEQLTKGLNYFTDEVVRRRRPPAPYGRA